MKTTSYTLELTAEQYDYFREELNRRVTPIEKRSHFPFYDEITVEDMGHSLRFEMRTLQRYYPYWNVNITDTGSAKRIEWSMPRMTSWIRFQCMIGIVWTCWFFLHRQQSIDSFVLLVLAIYALFAYGFYMYAKKDAQTTLSSILYEAANVARVRSLAKVPQREL